MRLPEIAKLAINLLFQLATQYGRIKPYWNKLRWAIDICRRIRDVYDTIVVDRHACNQNDLRQNKIFFGSDESCVLWSDN